MIISWTNVRAAALLYLDQMKKRDQQALDKIPTNEYTRSIYRHYYRNVTRKPRSSEPDMAEWNQQASDAVFKPASRWDNKKLQIQRSGHNHFIDSASQLLSTDGIITIYHEVRRRPAVSRINVVVKAASAGYPLYQKFLAAGVSSHACVADWKVMNPDLGSSGPDSAVIYLCETLGSANSLKLIGELQTALTDDLEAIDVFGLQKLDNGLYGCDIPSVSDQMNKLGIPQSDCGSAGTIICAVISKAVVLGYRDIVKRHIAVRDEERFLREMLRNVLGIDLGWDLGA